MNLYRDILDEHARLFEGLFAVLDRSEQWSAGPDAAFSYMHDRWLGVEHGPKAGKDEFTTEQRSAAMPFLRQLGVVDERVPTRMNYDEIVVLGAAGIGIHRRLGLVRRRQVVAPTLTVLTGLRPHEGHPRDGDIAELLALGGRFAAESGWVAPSELVFRSRLLRGEHVGPLVAAQVLVPSELALAELLITKHWPDLVAISVDLGSTLERAAGDLNELGPREYIVRSYRSERAPYELCIFNGRPVARAGGSSRPTTTSTIEEWALRGGGPRQDAVILFVANQPHTARVELDVAGALARCGRDDIQVDMCGTQAAADASIQLLLGELPARIISSRNRQAGNSVE